MPSSPPCLILLRNYGPTPYVYLRASFYCSSLYRVSLHSHLHGVPWGLHHHVHTMDYYLYQLLTFLCLLPHCAQVWPPIHHPIPQVTQRASFLKIRCDWYWIGMKMEMEIVCNFIFMYIYVLQAHGVSFKTSPENIVINLIFLFLSQPYLSYHYLWLMIMTRRHSNRFLPYLAGLLACMSPGFTFGKYNSIQFNS